MLLVRCPVCNAIKRIRRNQKAFRCCRMLFDVEKCKIAEGISRIAKPKENCFIEVEVEENVE